MVGETDNAELNGVQQKCVVEVVDCSPISGQYLQPWHIYSRYFQRICGVLFTILI